MGQTESKERKLFINLTRCSLAARGLQVGTSQIARFLHFVQEVSPWFPEEGTVNLNTCNKVGEELKLYYNNHGPQRVLVDAFSLWNVIQDTLVPKAVSETTAPPDEHTPLLAPAHLTEEENEEVWGLLANGPDEAGKNTSKKRGGCCQNQFALFI